jgi:hypothetical protein
MNEQIAYRIVEIKNNRPHSLFHGRPCPVTQAHNHGRSRQLKTNAWLKAERKLVRDGTGPWYESGFNVILDRDDCEEYLGRFYAPRILQVVQIRVRGELRKKEHSRSPVMLADEMYLPWEN